MLRSPAWNPRHRGAIGKALLEERTDALPLRKPSQNERVRCILDGTTRRDAGGLHVSHEQPLAALGLDTGVSYSALRIEIPPMRTTMDRSRN